MTDGKRLADPRPAVRALPRHSAVIIRHYDDPDRARLARDIIALCRARQNLVLIAGDARLALALGADGLHLPEAQLARGPAHWRLWQSPGKLLSVAAHSPQALAGAAKAGADFALLSPIFPSPSHPQGPAIGVHRFAAWTTQARLPVYALGGMNADNERRVLVAGATGWAAIAGLSGNKV